MARRSKSAFGDVEATRVIAGTASLQFAPGTRYSYVNQNFRLLSDALQDHTGRDFAELLRTRIFDRVGMGSALLAADTRAMPDGTEGYEGNVASGFRAAENRILWTGDAGLGASLDDMIAWERHIDATRDDAGGCMAGSAAPVTFADGAPAPYGFGLGRGREFGRAILGHGGALRGWRSHRLYVPVERVSVVVLFNHFGDAYGAAMEALGAVLDMTRPGPDATLPPPAWLGAYLEPETGLSARIDSATPGRLRLRYGHSAELLDLQADGSATGGQTRLRMAADGLWLDRPQENQSSRLLPCNGEATPDVVGRYRCAELGAELAVVDAGGTLYGGFSGCLGQGRMELLEPIARDVWALPCPRALDHTPPGDWTLGFRRAADGSVEDVTLGCWLARGLDYRRHRLEQTAGGGRARPDAASICLCNTTTHSGAACGASGREATPQSCLLHRLDQRRPTIQLRQDHVALRASRLSTTRATPRSRSASSASRSSCTPQMVIGTSSSRRPASATMARNCGTRAATSA